jgi:hypothetical protein
VNHPCTYLFNEFIEALLSPSGVSKCFNVVRTGASSGDVDRNGTSLFLYFLALGVVADGELDALLGGEQGAPAEVALGLGHREEVLGPRHHQRGRRQHRQLPQRQPPTKLNI